MSNIDNNLIRLAELSGYSKIPPTVDELLTDEYYLGNIGKNLYEYWRDVLRDLYPTPITSNYVYLVTQEVPAGTGKSYTSMIIMMVDLIRLIMLDDPHDFLGFDKSTPLSIIMANTTKERAETTLIKQFNEMLKQSPFFQDQLKMNGGELPHNIKIVPASGKKDLISHNVIGCIMSEINHYNRQSVAEEMLTEIISRCEGRVKFSSFNMFTHIILDSSPSNEESVINNFLKNPYYRSMSKVLSGPQWVVKASTGNYFNMDPKSFWIYQGDNSIYPFICDKLEDFDKFDNIDKDRIFEVPTEFRGAFDADIENSIKELLGKTTIGSDLFFANKDKVNQALYIDMVCDDCIDDISMFDDDRYIDRIMQDLLTIPQHRKVVIALDIGLKVDRAGFSVGYLSEFKTDLKNNTPKAIFKIPIAIGIGRPQGEETSLQKIIDLLLDINKIREIEVVHADSFASEMIFQQMELNGIKCKYKSVDKTDGPYNTFKSLVYSNRVLLPKNELLRKEMMELTRVGKKIDHIGYGSSKDISDSVCSVLTGLSELGLEAADLSTSSKIENYHNIIKQNNQALKQRRLRYASFGGNRMR